jgi:hypothetical protein
MIYLVDDDLPRRWQGPLRPGKTSDRAAHSLCKLTVLVGLPEMSLTGVYVLPAGETGEYLGAAVADAS